MNGYGAGREGASLGKAGRLVVSIMITISLLIHFYGAWPKLTKSYWCGGIGQWLRIEHTSILSLLRATSVFRMGATSA